MAEDKAALLMEETGCERGEADLALELAGYDLEQASRKITQLLKNIVVLKVKFRQEEPPRYGLLIVFLNLKKNRTVRLKTVVSYNPLVHESQLDMEWFDFEKHLYGWRLKQGALQDLSQRLEHQWLRYLDFRAAELIRRLKPVQESELHAFFVEASSGFFPPAGLRFQFCVQELYLGQFQSMRGEVRPGNVPTDREPPADWNRPESLVLRVALEGDSQGGIPCQALSPGDMVSVQIIDGRDIAQYLARLLGGRNAEGLVPFSAPVERVFLRGEEVDVQVRLSPALTGESLLPPDLKIKVLEHKEPEAWWKRFF
ncbi:MAG: hypothetical protein HY402_00250 [Elusimicrobia bacterium]|nr:hypothetical protein [Elusimicrobiota bacterium]